VAEECREWELASAAERRFLCHKLHKLIISVGLLLLLAGWELYNNLPKV